jgi:hypothetical protein
MSVTEILAESVALGDILVRPYRGVSDIESACSSEAFTLFPHSISSGENIRSISNGP